MIEADMNFKQIWYFGPWWFKYAILVVAGLIAALVLPGCAYYTAVKQVMDESKAMAIQEIGGYIDTQIQECYHWWCDYPTRAAMRRNFRTREQLQALELLCGPSIELSCEEILNVPMDNPTSDNSNNSN